MQQLFAFFVLIFALIRLNFVPIFAETKNKNQESELPEIRFKEKDGASNPYKFPRITQDKLNILDNTKSQYYENSKEQETFNLYSITLSDLRKKALKNNLEIKITSFDPNISNDVLRKEKAKFDQTLFVYADYKENKIPSFADDYFLLNSNDINLNNKRVKLKQDAQDSIQTSLNMGINIPLQSGGEISISSPLIRKKSYGEFGADEYKNALRFSITQPLLRGYGKEVNQASIKIAENKNKIQEQRLRLQTIRILAIVDKAYWELKKAWQILDLRRQQYEIAEKNLNIVKRRFEEGLVAKIEMTRAEVGVADQIENLIYAKTQLSIKNRQLMFFTNMLDNEDQNMIFSPISDPLIVEYNINKNKLLESALKNRIELIEQEIDITNRDLEVDFFKNQTLPLFSIQYQYGALSNTYNSLGKTYGGMLGDSYNDWMVGFKFELPISNEARKAELSKAINEKNKTLQTYELKKLTVKKEIFDAADILDQNWQRIKTTRQQVLVAGINYDAEIKQFEEGIRTMTEVLEALNRLGEVQIKEIEALIDYQISLIDLAYSTGSLLGFADVEI